MASSMEDPDKTEIRKRGTITPEASVQSSADIQSLVGSLLDHYRIESLVGQGGMGAVYRAIDQRLDRVVAVKVVPILHRKADTLRRFRIEAQSAAKLDHPNIARVYNVGETDKWNYIVFEFIEGINLRQLVLDRGPLSVDDATHFVCQVSDALQHASERGVVHRDIKPSNILLATDGKAKIVDMGLARTTALDRSQGDQTASGTTLGTFDYISPEQAHDPRDADVRSDIYSLGCTLYYLLTGQPPFPDGTALQKLLMHGSKMPEDPRIFRDDLSDPLIAILKKMMAKKPRDRYQTPEDLASDLRMFAKIENLAWSSDLAEFALGSSQSRRSWFEALLPVILSGTSIAAVTLWLVNANQNDAVFSIPKVEIANVSLASNSESPDATADESVTQSASQSASVGKSAKSDTSPGNTKEQGSSEIGIRERQWTHFLVSSEPDQVSLLQDTLGETKPKSFKSLDEALADAANLSTACRIWIAQDCAIQKPWRSPGADRASWLQIQSIPDHRYSIRIDDSAVSGKSGEIQSCFELDGGQLSLEDVDVLWTIPVSNASAKALVSAKPGSRCTMQNSTFTIVGPSTAGVPSLIAIDTRNRDVTSGQGTASTQRFTEARIERCAVRGQCDLVHSAPSERLEMRIRDSWFAISGSMIVSQGNRFLNRSPRVRVEISDSTCITLKPWLRIELSNATPYPIAVVRIANQCIFAGAKSIVEWDATDCTDWVFSNQVKKLDDLGRWIDFRGLDNAYDGGSIEELIRVQMSMSSEELQIDTDSNLLRNELGMEVLGIWQQRNPWDPINMQQAVPVSIPPGTLGIEIGAAIDRIPAFPSL
jgi:serine/threonine protein kinase